MKIDRKGALAEPTPRLYVGPLASQIDSFAEFLAHQGYAPGSVTSKCLLVADLSRWLKRRGLTLAQMDEGILKQFHAHHRSSIRRGDVATSQQMLTWLRGFGVVPALPQTVDRTVLGRLTQDYERFLSSQRGLAPATLRSYLPIVRRFLTERFGNSTVHVEDLRPRDLHRFILRQVPRGSRNYSKLMVTALRSFLGFLFQRGAIKIDLLAGVPGVANWRLSHLPKSLPPDQVERLLRCCDRNTPSGQRDYAILLLLARLGLRGGEVLAMTLGRPGLGAGRDHRARQRSAIRYIAVAEGCGCSAGPLSAARSSCMFDAHALHPHESSAARSSPERHLLRHSSRAEARGIGPRFQRGASASAFPRDQYAAQGRLSRRDWPTAASRAADDDTDLRQGGYRSAAPYCPSLDGRRVMNKLRTVLDEYLAVRRALGHKLREPAQLLQQFVDFAEQAGASYITTELALKWATQPAHAQRTWWAARLGDGPPLRAVLQLPRSTNPSAPAGPASLSLPSSAAVHLSRRGDQSFA